MQNILKRSLIKLQGPDSAKLLQGMITNDIYKTTEEQLIYTLMLNSQGRYLADFFIFSLNQEEFILDIDPINLDLVYNKLNSYKLRSKVEITKLTNEYTICFSDRFDSSAIISSLDPRIVNFGYRALYSTDIANKNAIKTDDHLYLTKKYELSIPEGDLDLVKEKSIPLEYGFDYLNAIDFTKGCYIGQEFTSRTKHTGIVRKEIYAFICEKNITNLKKEDDIYLEDQKIGKICSFFENKAILLLRNELVQDLETIKISDYIGHIKKPLWRKK